MNLTEFESVVSSNAAIRRVRRMQPVGGPGDKVFPPTYPGEGRNATPRHVFETRRLNGADVSCVLLDSVQSQANRLEEALEDAIRRGELSIPRLVVDFAGTDVADVGEISSLVAPHRVFDAILRDSRLEDEPFKASQIHASLVAASLRDASALYRHAPTSLVFGAWNSTGEGGGLGAKFPRAVVSEIVGVHAVAGKRTSSRIDPLGIRAGVKVRKTDGDWVVVDEQDPATATTGVPGKKAKLLRPSEVNHGNIAPNVTDGVSVTMDYALHTFVLSFAALRRLRFGSQSAEATALGRTVLALIGLVAAMEQEVMGFALRSRCDLVPDPDAPDHQRGALEIVAPDGSTRRVELSRATTHALLIEAVRKAGAAGLPWEAEPVRLVPDPRLVLLVERSRAMALKGDADAEED